MITRRTLVVAGSALAASFSSGLSAYAQSPSTSEKIDVLFVQTSKGMTFDKTSGKLTLADISPITLFFSDRPERIAGNMQTAVFSPFWAKGKNSFLSDPPNADLSILDGDVLRQVVVVLRDPALEGDNFTYNVKILKGDMPDKAADVSLFIDVVGMPATPVSYAGVGRRSYRRAVIYH